jgi:hypothetical protein
MPDLDLHQDYVEFPGLQSRPGCPLSGLDGQDSGDWGESVVMRGEGSLSYGDGVFAWRRAGGCGGSQHWSAGDCR